DPAAAVAPACASVDSASRAAAGGGEKPGGRIPRLSSSGPAEGPERAQRRSAALARWLGGERGAVDRGRAARQATRRGRALRAGAAAPARDALSRLGNSETGLGREPRLTGRSTAGGRC